MKLFLLRWNPNVSSFKDETFLQMIADSREGPVRMDWSVREWEKLEEWDWAVLCRVGTDADGIVAIGRFEVPVVDFFIDGSAAGEFLGRFARAGAKLEWTAWNPAESGSVELTSDWFETIVRPTGLDAVVPRAGSPG